MIVKFWTGKKRALWQIDAIGAALCLVASLAVYCTVLHPIFKQRSFLAGQRDELAVRREESSDLSASMLTLDNQLTAVKKELVESNIRLESSDRTNQRLAALTTLFMDCSLAVDDIQVGKISPGLMWDLVPINITGRGQYSKCIALLDTLRRTFADMNMARLRLEGNPVKSDEASRFRFQLLWHTTPKTQTAKNE